SERQNRRDTIGWPDLRSRKRNRAASGRGHTLSHNRRGGGSYAHPGTAAQRPERHGARARGARRAVVFRPYRRHQRTEWSRYHRRRWARYSGRVSPGWNDPHGATTPHRLNYPSPNALQDFKILASGAQAEYGRHRGGVFIAVTRSGTNQFHGALCEYL